MRPAEILAALPPPGAPHRTVELGSEERALVAAHELHKAGLLVGETITFLFTDKRPPRRVLHGALTAAGAAALAAAPADAEAA